MFIQIDLSAQFSGYQMTIETFGLEESDFSTILQLDNYLYFLDSSRKKLWVHDLKKDTTRTLMKSTSEMYIGSPVEFRGYVVFTVLCDGGTSLVRTRNSFSSTEKVFQLTRNFEDESFGLFPYEDYLYVSPSGSTQIFRIDSNFTGIYPFIDMKNLGEVKGNRGRRFFVFKSSMHFYGDIDEQKVIWVTNGTASETHPITDSQGSALTGIRDPLFWNGRYFITAQDGRAMTWIYDGIDHAATAFLNVDLKISSEPLPYKNGLILDAIDDEHGLEPWFFDGTKEGTVLLQDIRINGNTNLRPFHHLNGKVNFISPNYDTDTYEIYESDGTPNGTFQVGTLGANSGITAVAGGRQFYIYNIDTGETKTYLDEYLGGGDVVNIRSFEGNMLGVADFVSTMNDYFFIHFGEFGIDSCNNWIVEGSTTNTFPSPYNIKYGKIRPLLTYDSVLYVKDMQGAVFSVYRIHDPSLIRETVLIDSSEYFDRDICFSEVITESYNYNVSIDLRIYPNPALGYININSVSSRRLDVQIISINGTVVHRSFIVDGDNRVTLDFLNPGVYNILVTDEIGKFSISKRLVKH